MINWKMDIRLKQWACWYQRVWVDRSAGWPGVSPLTGFGMPARTGRVHEVFALSMHDLNMECEALHEHMKRCLSAADFETIKVYYVTARCVARRAALLMNCTHPTVKRRVALIAGRIGQAEMKLDDQRAWLKAGTDG